MEKIVEKDPLRYEFNSYTYDMNKGAIQMIKFARFNGEIVQVLHFLPGARLVRMVRVLSIAGKKISVPFAALEAI